MTLTPPAGEPTTALTPAAAAWLNAIVSGKKQKHPKTTVAKAASSSLTQQPDPQIASEENGVVASRTDPAGQFMERNNPVIRDGQAVLNGEAPSNDAPALLGGGKEVPGRVTVDGASWDEDLAGVWGHKAQGSSAAGGSSAVKEVDASASSVMGSKACGLVTLVQVMEDMDEVGCREAASQAESAMGVTKGSDSTPTDALPSTSEAFSSTAESQCLAQPLMNPFSNLALALEISGEINGGVSSQPSNVPPATAELPPSPFANLDLVLGLSRDISSRLDEGSCMTGVEPGGAYANATCNETIALGL